VPFKGLSLAGGAGEVDGSSSFVMSSKLSDAYLSKKGDLRINKKNNFN